MNFINNFNNLSRDIKNYIQQISKIHKFKNRKTSLSDGILFKLLYTIKNATQESVTTKLNLYNKIDASRVAYIKKINKINVNTFHKLHNYFNKRINYYFNNNINNQYIIYAVDGTYIQLKESLTTDCKRKKNTGSVTTLSTGIYNVTYDTPTLIKIENNETSEKISFSNIFDEIKQTDTKDIYVFDRGYVDYKLFNKININNKYFICRIKKNTLKIDNSKDDFIITTTFYDDSKKIKYEKLRVVKYIINNSIFYLGTNLFDGFDIKSLKDIYHKRWSIEEYFKMLKNTTNINNINEESIKNIEKSFICYNIISKLTYLIKNNVNQQIENNKNKIKKINLSNLQNSLYTSDFYCQFINGSFDSEQLKIFFKIVIKYIYMKTNRSYPRICKRSNHLSYYKSYTNYNKK